MDVVFKSKNKVFNLRVAGIWIENGHVLVHHWKVKQFGLYLVVE